MMSTYTISVTYTVKVKAPDDETAVIEALVLAENNLEPKVKIISVKP